MPAPATPTLRALNFREQRFVDALVADPSCTQTDAAIRAGYSVKTAKQTGSELMARPHIKAAVAAARQAMAQKAESDGVYVLRRLKENDTKAYSNDDVAASNGALSLIGKMAGLFEKRVRISFDDPAALVAHLRALPLDQRRAAILEILGEGLQ